MPSLPVFNKTAFFVWNYILCFIKFANLFITNASIFCSLMRNIFQAPTPVLESIRDIKTRTTVKIYLPF